MLGTNVFFVTTAAIYSEFLKPNMLHQQESVGSVVLTILILVIMFGAFFVSFYKLRFLKSFKSSFTLMWNGDTANLASECTSGDESQVFAQVDDELLLQVGRKTNRIPVDGMEEPLLRE